MCLDTGHKVRTTKAVHLKNNNHHPAMKTPNWENDTIIF